MADNRNMELNDEEMANASGGTGGSVSGSPKFKTGDHVLYTLTNPQTGQTMTITGSVTAVNFSNEANQWKYSINPDPNEFNVTELQAVEDHLTYA